MMDREELIVEIQALPLLGEKSKKLITDQLKADGERIAALEELEQTALAVRTMLMKRNVILDDGLRKIEHLCCGVAPSITKEAIQARQAAKELSE